MGASDIIFRNCFDMLESKLEKVEVERDDLKVELDNLKEAGGDVDTAQKIAAVKQKITKDMRQQSDQIASLRGIVKKVENEKADLRQEISKLEREKREEVSKLEDEANALREELIALRD